MLDSKDERDRALVADAPLIDSYMSADAGAFFDKVMRGLEAARVPFERTPTLVRGLDYYRHTTFEFVTTHLGAQGTVIAGGRYDGLIEAMGGPATPAVGWAGGIERLSMLIDEPGVPAVDVAVVPMGAAAEQAAFGLLQGLRSAGISAEQGWRGNMKKRLERAAKSGARWALILGDDELAAGEVAVKDLTTGEQRKGPLDRVVDVVKA